MKKLVLGAAEHLLRENGSVTTLEIKNWLHNTKKGDPSFAISQSEVSHFARELAKEKGWAKKLDSSASNPHFVYTEKKTTSPSRIPAVPVSISKTPSVGSSSISSKIVCYVSSNPKLYIEDDTRKDARRKVFQANKPTMPTLSYDNINYCSSKFFFKNKLK
jgi:hypothetical protein